MRDGKRKSEESYVRGATDKIDLSLIDAIQGTDADDAFAFIGDGVFTNTAGELRAQFDATNSTWTIQGDTNGDGIADFQLLTKTIGDQAITINDFWVWIRP